MMWNERERNPGKKMKSEELGDVGGVDGVKRVGGEALEMIMVRVGEEVVPLPPRVRRPRIHREGQPSRHFDRHPLARSLSVSPNRCCSGEPIFPIYITQIFEIKILYLCN